MSKHAHGTLSEMREVQRIRNKAAGLPSPGSKLRDGVWVNVCPKCDADTVSGPPWACSSCGWDAATSPRGCCLNITPIRAYGKEYAVCVDEMDDANPRLTESSKSKAIEVPVEALGDEVDDTQT